MSEMYWADRLRAEHEQMAAALARIAGQTYWSFLDGTCCSSCYRVWPRELRDGPDECKACIARAARDAAVGVGKK